jgi:hypothetical protein
VDNAKGYVAGNVFIISKEMNLKKRDCTLEDSVSIAVYMATHIKNGEVGKLNHK